MRKIFIISILFTSTFSVFGQEDYYAKYKKIGISFGANIIMLKYDNNTPYNPSYGGLTTISFDYKKENYKNAFGFFKGIILRPIVEFHYSCGKFSNHSIGFGYRNTVDRFDGYDSHSIRDRLVYYEYAVNLFKIKKDSLIETKLFPYIACRLAFNNKESLFNTINSTTTYKDNSNLFLTQLSVGIKYSKQLHVSCAISANLFGFVEGKYEYKGLLYNGTTYYYGTENEKYSKMLFTPQLIKDGFLIDNINFTIGFNF